MDGLLSISAEFLSGAPGYFCGTVVLTWCQQLTILRLLRRPG